MSFNKITIVGFLGRDPELKHTPQGTAVCKFSVATTEKRKDASGEYQEHTTWFRITVWGRQAELCNEYLSKGKQVYVEGRFRLEEYVDREAQTRLSPEVSATDVQFLGTRGDSPDDAPKAKGAGVGGSRDPQASANERGRTRTETVHIDSDDIPF